MGFLVFPGRGLRTIMEVPSDQEHGPGSSAVLSNAEIADRLAGLAQLLSSQKENPYKVKANRACNRLADARKLRQILLAAHHVVEALRQVADSRGRSVIRVRS